MSTQEQRKKFPHVYVVLLTIVVICAILTYIVPAGEYERVEAPDGRMVVDPVSYTRTESNPIPPFGILEAIPKGMVDVASIIFFIFIVGGAFGVVEATGAFEGAINNITSTMKGRERWIIPIVMFIFSLGGGIFGMAEETLPFIPIMVSLAVSLGFDSLVGAGMVLTGAGAGFSGAFLNPFTVGVAQGVAGLPTFSGLAFRIVMYVVMVTATILWMIRYSDKVKKDPTRSLMYELDKKRDEADTHKEMREFLPRDRWILLIVLATIVMLVVGVIAFGWYIQEIAALFLGMAIVVSIVGGLGFNGFGEELVNGMANMAGGALVVGFARAILVVLSDGMILDTILHATSNLVSQLPSSLTAVGMYVFQVLLNFLIPSGSGQAAVSIPIMAPLADLVGVTRQTAVVAYQLGDGISNIFTPTSGYFIAGLALAKIPYDRWARWILPLISLQYALGAVFVIAANLIHLGPF